VNKLKFKDTPKKIKFFLFISFLMTSLVVMGSGQDSFSQPGSVQAKVEDSGSSNLQSEVQILQEKVSNLEKIVSDQSSVIEEQRQSLEKVMAFVASQTPEIVPPEPTMLVERFVIDGANLLSPKDFEKVLGKYRNTEISMTGLKSVADEITAFYRKKGYMTTLVYVPEQEIADNTVEFKVVEGHVGDITFEEPKYSKSETIKKRFLLTKGEIFDSNKLEANLRLINQQQDRILKAVLSPGTIPQTSDILVKVEEEESPHHFYTDFNNRGTKNTSQNRWGLGYVNNNLTGRDDVLSVRTVANGGVDVYSLSAAYTFPVSRYDTRVGGYVGYSKADIGGQFAVLSPEGHAKVWGLFLSQPWLDEKFYDEESNTNLALTSNLTAGFDSISVYNKILGRETSHDELRVFKIGFNFEEIDDLGRGGFDGQAYFGVPDFLGSMGQHEESASRIDAGGKFEKYIISFSRITRLPASSALVNTFKYQFSKSPLVNSEQMRLGGADTVRGYPENEYLADYGWINSVEIRTPAFFLPPILRVPFDKNRTSLVDAIQLVGFIDAGKGYLNNARVGEVKDKYLVGAGFGFRFDFYEHLHGRLDVGFPMSDEPSDKSSSTVHFGLQYEW